MLQITDSVGTEHRFSDPPLRVVSLVPSITETLFDLGVGDRLVGVTGFCIFPEDIPEELVRLGGTKNPDIEKIRALQPDLVHVNVEENLPRHARQIESFSTVFATEPRSVDDVRRLLDDLGRLHQAEREASEWIARIDQLREEISGRESFTFLCPIWKEPWMWCGGDTYVSGLITAAGGINLLADQKRYPRIPLETALTMKPEVILLPDEPYLFIDADAAALSREAGGDATILGPFPGHLVTWHGTRTLRGLEFLRKYLP